MDGALIGGSVFGGLMMMAGGATVSGGAAAVEGETLANLMLRSDSQLTRGIGHERINLLRETIGELKKKDRWDTIEQKTLRVTSDISRTLHRHATDPLSYMTDTSPETLHKKILLKTRISRLRSVVETNISRLQAVHQANEPSSFLERHILESLSQLDPTDPFVSDYFSKVRVSEDSDVRLSDIMQGHYTSDFKQRSNPPFREMKPSIRLFHAQGHLQQLRQIQIDQLSVYNTNILMPLERLGHKNVVMNTLDQEVDSWFSFMSDSLVKINEATEQEAFMKEVQRYEFNLKMNQGFRKIYQHLYTSEMTDIQRVSDDLFLMKEVTAFDARAVRRVRLQARDLSFHSFESPPPLFFQKLLKIFRLNKYYLIVPK